MLAKNTTIAGVVLGMLFAARAHAQPDPDSETKPLDAAAASAGGEGGEQLTLPKGRLVVNAYLGIGLSDGATFKPISLSPDIWYGVTTRSPPAWSTAPSAPPGSSAGSASRCA